MSSPRPDDPTDTVLELRGVTMRYGDHVAVDHVDLDVRRGEVIGILGHNGAGKTTTVECAQGLRTPSAGSVRILGLDVHRDRRRLGARVGSQLQDSSLPDRLRVGEALRLFSNDPITPDAVERWGLAALWSKPFGSLSGGQQQRLFIALALVNRPDVVFLDELTQGLDPMARHETWKAIRQVQATGTTVVLVTHFADEAEALCGRIAVMNRGRLVADGTPDGLIAAHGGGVGVRFSLPDADSAELRSIPGVEHVTLSRDDVEVRGDRSMLAHLGAHLVSLGGSPPELRVTEPTLEDALMQIVQASDTTPASTAARHHPLEAR